MTEVFEELSPSLLINLLSILLTNHPGNPNCRGKLSTVDPPFKIDYFVKIEIYSFSIKSSKSGLIGARRSTVLILCPSEGFPESTLLGS
jgi:hypothetical protein